MRVAVNFVAFQTGWFAAVLGAAGGYPWLGMLVVPALLLLHLALSAHRRHELSLALAAGLLGFAVDSALIAVHAFAPVPFGTSPPLSPLWMVMLWINQAMTLNYCMAWLRGRYLLGALFGAVGGPLAYLAGAKLGAAAVPSSEGIVILAACWAIAFPLLLALNAALRGAGTLK